jgi:uncharacterized iron-regulated protein
MHKFNSVRLLVGLALFFLSFSSVQAQELKAFQFYTEKGDSIAFYDMAEKLTDYDVVLFGEFHDNSMNHWLQLKLAKALHKKKNNKLVLGAEMLERQQQEGLDSLLNGNWETSQFLDSLSLSPNFKTDYLPLVEVTKAHNLKFIATNVPRSYAALVAQSGMDTLRSLPKDEKEFFAKTPINLDMKTPGYQEMLKMMGDHSGMQMEPKQMVEAQALKDATMAESILNNLNKNQLFLHFNGNYHSKAHGGIYWYLKKQKPNLKIAVISVFEAEGETLKIPEKSEVLPGQKPSKPVLTEFNLVLPKDMSKSY